MIGTKEKEKTDFDRAFCLAEKLIKDCYQTKKYSSLPKSLSGYEILGVLALQKAQRKKVVGSYLRAHDLLSIIEVGSLAWVLSRSLSDYDQEELILVENFFTKYEDYFDSLANEDGLIPSTWVDSWIEGFQRKGILVEVQALYYRILSLLDLLTKDDLYVFKKKRLQRSIKKSLWGAYVLDRVNCLEVRSSGFLAAFISPEIFTKREWEITFDFFLKEKNLWLKWGGINTLSRSDARYQGQKEGSWFFLNNIAAVVLFNLNAEKYQVFIDKIFKASSKNILWQNHVGRACEIFVNSSGKLLNKGHFSLSTATFLYLCQVWFQKK